MSDTVSGLPGSPARATPGADVGPPIFPQAREVSLARREAVDEAEVVLAPLAAAGVMLARLVLWFIAAGVVLVLALVAFEDWADGTGSLNLVYKNLGVITSSVPPASDAAQNESFLKSLAADTALINAIASERRDTREFIIKLAQLILLTLLLPVLTALLGYIFGTRQGEANATGKTGG